MNDQAGGAHDRVALDVSVCVPVYRAHPRPNLASLADTMESALDGLRGELVVALNGVTIEESRAPEWAQTVDLGVNRGVSPGWNAAAEVASGNVLVFANDDVLLGARSLRVMHDVLLAREEAGIVGVVGTRWDLRAPKHLEYLDLSGTATGSVHACDVVAGFLFAMRRNVWQALGGFDEAYAPCSLEDVDACTAVRKQLGLECYAITGVEYEHEFGISVTSPWKRIRHNGRSELLRSVHMRNLRHFRRKWRELV